MCFGVARPGGWLDWVAKTLGDFDILSENKWLGSPGGQESFHISAVRKLFSRIALKSIEGHDMVTKLR